MEDSPLTYRENVTDTARLDADFTKFIRLVRNKYPSYQYVAVRELQERGALHMHIACCGKQDIEHLRACWYVAIGGLAHDAGENTKGAVNVRARAKRFSGVSPIWPMPDPAGKLTQNQLAAIKPQEPYIQPASYKDAAGMSATASPSE